MKAITLKYLLYQSTIQIKQLLGLHPDCLLDTFLRQSEEDCLGHQPSSCQLGINPRQSEQLMSMGGGSDTLIKHKA